MYIIIVVVNLLIFGLILVFPAAKATCSSTSEILCIISQMFIKLPTWIGTFIGVFVSATLAYKLSIKKQNQDEARKKNEEEYKKLNKLQALASNCFSDIASIKLTYLPKIGNKESISRSMLHPYMIAPKNEAVKFDSENYYFLIPNGKSVDQVSLRNPNYLSNIFHRFNAVIALYEKRNEFAYEIHKVIVGNSNALEQKGSVVISNMDFIIQKVGLNEFLNYIQLSEKLYMEVDLCIEQLSAFLLELPHVANNYLKLVDSPYRLRMVDNRTEFNVPLFEPLPELDVSKEINRIVDGYNSQCKKDWRPDNYFEFNW